MSISIVIPSKSLDNIIPCCEAIRAGDDGDVEIVVIDDGIDWGEWQPSEFYDRFRPCTILEGFRPFVFARNVNLGLSYSFDYLRYEATGDIMAPPRHRGAVVLNDDAILERGSFSFLAEQADAASKYGIVGVTTNVTGQPLQRPFGHGLREVPHLAFVGVYIPRSTYESVGPLDERYCLDYGVEDRDYCEAVARAGLKIGVHDGCYVDHGSLVSEFRGRPGTPKDFSKNLALFRDKVEYCNSTGQSFRAGVGLAG